MAYQIAFDMYESATQQFLGRVLQALRYSAPIPSAAQPSSVSAGETAAPTAVPVVEEAQPAQPERDIESLVSISVFCRKIKILLQKIP